MISGNLTVLDLVEADRLHCSRAIRRSFILDALACALRLLLIAVNQILFGFIAIGAGIGGALGQLATMKFYWPWKAARQLKQTNLYGHITYDWDSEHLHIQNSTEAVKRTWSSYVKVVENENLILLYVTDRVFQLVPKRWFTNNDQLAEFLALPNRGGG